jgi:glutamate-1-semialdehyde 2,1-aminomutase
MKHPGTFNANPLSASAGIATLKIVATGEPCRRANEAARLLRQKLNDLFKQRGWDWVCYGEFSGFRFLPGYQGPRPGSDEFVPYGGALEKLDAPRNARLVHAFRRGMLLHGVDLPGLGGMTMAAHTEADVEQTVAAVAATLAAVQQGLV